MTNTTTTKPTTIFASKMDTFRPTFSDTVEDIFEFSADVVDVLVEANCEPHLALYKVVKEVINDATLFEHMFFDGTRSTAIRISIAKLIINNIVKYPEQTFVDMFEYEEADAKTASYFKKYLTGDDMVTEEYLKIGKVGRNDVSHTIPGVVSKISWYEKDDFIKQLDDVIGDYVADASPITDEEILDMMDNHGQTVEITVDEYFDEEDNFVEKEVVVEVELNEDSWLMEQISHEGGLYAEPIDETSTDKVLSDSEEDNENIGDWMISQLEIEERIYPDGGNVSEEYVPPYTIEDEELYGDGKDIEFYEFDTNGDYDMYSEMNYYSNVTPEFQEPTSKGFAEETSTILQNIELVATIHPDLQEMIVEQEPDVTIDAASPFGDISDLVPNDTEDAEVIYARPRPVFSVREPNNSVLRICNEYRGYIQDNFVAHKDVVETMVGKMIVSDHPIEEDQYELVGNDIRRLMNMLKAEFPKLENIGEDSSIWQYMYERSVGDTYDNAKFDNLVTIQKIIPTPTIEINQNTIDTDAANWLIKNWSIPTVCYGNIMRALCTIDYDRLSYEEKFTLKLVKQEMEDVYGKKVKSPDNTLAYLLYVTYNYTIDAMTNYK